MKEQERTEEKTWRKIAKCDAGACVEVRELPGVVEVRSSRHPTLTVEFTKDEWDAFLAGLRATESAERGEVVGEAESDVELAARAICAATRPTICVVRDDGVCLSHRGPARAVVAALAGRLLPPVVQTREEWGVVTDEWGTVHTCDDGRTCTHWFPVAHKHVRTITTLADDGSPYGGATLTGKWRNVDE